MKKLSDFIVKKRNLILLVAVLLLIPSVIGYARTKVNYDLLSYLPQDAESMIGQKSSARRCMRRTLRAVSAALSVCGVPCAGQ